MAPPRYERELTLDGLTAAITAYTPLRQAIPAQEQIDGAVAWATRKLNHTVALVTDEDGLEPLDLVMDRFVDSTDRIPAVLSEMAMAIASPIELQAIGYSAYESGDHQTARTAWIGANTPTAAFNLGFLLADRVDPPEPVEARRWYETAATAGDTDAMVNLGILLATRVDPPELVEARRWFEQAATAGHTGAATQLRILNADAV